MLVALKTYESGRGEKGKLTWQVNQSVVSALDAAFYMTFKVRNGHFIWHAVVGRKSVYFDSVTVFEVRTSIKGGARILFA